MLKIFLVAVCAFAFVSSRASKKSYDHHDHFHDFDDDYFGSASNNYEHGPEYEHVVAQAAHEAVVAANNPGNAGGNGGVKKGFSAGSGLRSIAQGSADQANNAVLNQHAAGNQAAYVAKNTLAQAAAGASATAQAALAGKQILLQGLEQQLRDAQVALEGETQQLEQAQRSAVAAQQASQQAQQHVNILTTALNAAQQTAEQANQAASEAAGELAAQQAMVGGARERLRTLAEQLRGVRIDFEATQAAARKAQAAAQQAQANAAEAAAAAAASLNALGGEAQGGDGGGSEGNSGNEENAAAEVSPETFFPYAGYYIQ